jgi:hypothetical protein
MQLLFSFDQAMKVEKTLMQTFACQLSCNSCSRLIKQWKFRKFSCKLSLACQLSCNSCSRLIKQWKLRKLSWKLSLLNSHATFVLVWSSNESWENSHGNSRFSTLMQLLFSFEAQGLGANHISLASELSWITNTFYDLGYSFRTRCDTWCKILWPYTNKRFMTDVTKSWMSKKILFGARILLTVHTSK